MIAVRRFQDLTVKLLQAFLDAPALKLTLPQARRRFSSDAAICAAVLSVLVEAGVLSRTSQGQYVRLSPRTTGRAAASDLKGKVRAGLAYQPTRSRRKMRASKIWPSGNCAPAR